MVGLRPSRNAWRMARRSHLRARAADAAVAIVLLLAAASGPLLGYWLRTAEPFGGPDCPTADWEYRSSAEAEITGAVALVILGGLAIVLLRRTPWLWLLIAAGGAVSLVLAHRDWEAGVATGPAEWWEPEPATSLFFLAFVPTSWPLLVLAPAAVVVGLHRLARGLPRLDATE